MAKKVYIMLNKIEGWKVVVDGKHVDASKPLETFKELEDAEKYCRDNELEVIRISM